MTGWDHRTLGGMQRRRQIYDLIPETGGYLNQRAVASAIGVSYVAVCRMLQRMRDEGHIQYDVANRDRRGSAWVTPVTRP